MVHGTSLLSCFCCSPTSAATPDDTLASKTNDELSGCVTFTSKAAAHDRDHFGIEISAGQAYPLYATVHFLVRALERDQPFCNDRQNSCIASYVWSQHLSRATSKGMMAILVMVV